MRELSEVEKKKIAVVVGEDLVRTNGKKKYYSQKEIKKSLDHRKIDIDWYCWAYCLYMDHDSFDTYHQSIGEACDYTAMKGSMLAAATDHISDGWFDFDFDLSWIDLPDFDFFDLFDFIDL